MYFLTATTKHGLRSKCFGYYLIPKAWEDTLLEKPSLFRDERFDYVVIERIEAGCAALAEEIQWYEWSIDRWEKCQKPEYLKEIRGFSIK